MDITAVNQSGRPSLYSEEIVDQARAYLKTYESVHGHPFPSIVGMCRVLGCSRVTLYNWAKDEDKEFSDILDQCNELQEFELLNKGIVGEFNSNITKLLLGRHGYHDRQDTHLTGAHGGPIENKWTVEIVDAAKDLGRD